MSVQMSTPSGKTAMETALGKAEECFQKGDTRKGWKSVKTAMKDAPDTHTSWPHCSLYLVSPTPNYSNIPSDSTHCVARRNGGSKNGPAFFALYSRTALAALADMTMLGVSDADSRFI